MLAHAGISERCPEFMMCGTALPVWPPGSKNRVPRARSSRGFWFIPSIGVADGFIFDRGGEERGRDPGAIKKVTPYAISLSIVPPPTGARISVFI